MTEASREPGRTIRMMPWTEVAPFLAAGATAVLPIGAIAKEHGPHLPLATDFMTAEALGGRLAKVAKVLVWPAVGYGFYPAFTAYPGSTSLTEETFGKTLNEICADLERAGATRVLLMNTGISTIDAVEQTRRDYVHVYRGAHYLACCKDVLEQPRGGHADEGETSVMLHLFGDAILVGDPPTWTEPVAPGRWSPDDPSSASFSPSGIFGDATLATSDKGARLVDAMIADLLDAL